MAGLDNFLADASNAIGRLKAIVDELAKESGQLQWSKEVASKLQSSYLYLKTDYKVSMLLLHIWLDTIKLPINAGAECCFGGHLLEVLW